MTAEPTNRRTPFQAQSNLKPIKVFLFLLMMLVCHSAALTQGLSNMPGAFSEVGFGVRPGGMGNAYTAISNDANAFLTNPAGLLLGARPIFTANYAKLFGIVPSGYFGVLHPMGKRWSLGGGFLFLGDDALMENTFGVSAAATLPNFPIGGNEIYFDQMSFGITVKGRWASFGNNSNGGVNQVRGSGSGYAVDLGYLLKIDRKLTIGLMLRDLFNSFSWNSSAKGRYHEGLPATLRFGGSYILDGITIALDFRKKLHKDTTSRSYFGVEKTFFKILMLRAGFSNNLASSELNRRWTFGFSLLRGVMDDYLVGVNTAYRVDNLDHLFRFGLDFSWGASNNKPPAGRIY